jgi:FkbM family methyltransferase
MIGSLLDTIQRKLGNSKISARLAIKMRNQSRAIIKYHLGGIPDPQRNGEAWLIHKIAPKALTFVDVGANVGNWASLFLQHTSDDCRGLLFEPSDAAFKCLRKRLGNSKGVEVIKAAVGDRAGHLPFWEDPGGGEASSLSPQASNKGFIEKIVAVKTLDENIEKRRWEYVDFLKIDAEGYDLHVLRGAADLLSKQRIKVIQFEYGEFWPSVGSTLAVALSLLHSFEYKVFLLKATGLYELDYNVYGEYYSYSNYVAVAPSAMTFLQYTIKGQI